MLTLSNSLPIAHGTNSGALEERDQRALVRVEIESQQGNRDSPTTNSSKVAAIGVEPIRLAAQDPKSCVSANFTKRPCILPLYDTTGIDWVRMTNSARLCGADRRVGGIVAESLPDLQGQPNHVRPSA